MASNHLFENQNELAIMTTLNVGSNSPLAQVGRKQCALVTDERFGGASTSESGDLARLLFLSLLFYLFIYLFPQHVWVQILHLEGGFLFRRSKS